MKILTLSGKCARHLVDPFYVTQGSKTQARDTDLFFVALENEKVFGSVRFCVEENTSLLRGMHVDKHFQRNGVGLSLLKEFENYLIENKINKTFCIPYAHLEKFYSTIGFEKIEQSLAPLFLQQRIEHYRQKQSQQMILMIRK